MNCLSLEWHYFIIPPGLCWVCANFLKLHQTRSPSVLNPSWKSLTTSVPSPITQLRLPPHTSTTSERFSTAESPLSSNHQNCLFPPDTQFVSFSLLNYCNRFFFFRSFKLLTKLPEIQNSGVCTFLQKLSSLKKSFMIRPLWPHQPSTSTTTLLSIDPALLMPTSCLHLGIMNPTAFLL